ncbi:hypothetical protein R3W88_023775 [Solanum pinnatisectum]|nr:hypothetical protein R3W88_023775 [Solanum pinnatisectum]
MEDALWSDCIPSDILGLISSRLVAAEYFVFRAVCKKWRYTPVTPPHCPAQPEKSPCLITLRGDTGIIDFFHPVYNVMTTTSIPIPKLMDSRIRSSKGNWLLISNGSRDMFFFNPISNDIVELPDLQEEYENICTWTFSCPPDSPSSACFVVGFDYLDSGGIGRKQQCSTSLFCPTPLASYLSWVKSYPDSGFTHVFRSKIRLELAKNKSNFKKSKFPDSDLTGASSSSDAVVFTATVVKFDRKLIFDTAKVMPKVKTNRVKYPEGWELIEPTLSELQAKMREAENDPHDGKRKCEALWPIFKIAHQKSRYIFDLFHRRKEISKELYEFCMDQGYADRNLIAKWKKPGYERLCCLRCMQPRDHNFQTTCVCRVPQHLREEKVIECVHCGCKGCASGD